MSWWEQVKGFILLWGPVIFMGLIVFFLWRTMRLMPLSLTRKMVLSGYRVPAAELYRRGIIEDCVPLEQLMPTAMKLANEIAKKSPMALKLAKRAINTVETMSLKDGYRFEQNLTVEMTQHEDSKEAMRAFIEKREAVFKDVI